ncbi:MAG TPA: flagellar basal body M-ring protein FliF, partial [Campylobacteraceae bacterium]|nr:flagellar basal body M-ring protein FliF [Campylobacteraceae bacterium]
MDFKTLIAQITAITTKLSKRQKIVIAASTLAVIAFLVFLVLYTNSRKTHDGYRVLFDHISPADSALVIEQLEKENIPYRIVNEGTIEVPKEYVYKERIAIAAQGIPKSGKIGFELFDKTNFGETDFAQKIKYLRALEGELSKTVVSLSPIEDAQVHIALPKESVFVEEKSVPTASVVLKIREGGKLTSRQITGIKNLVAASVPELTPDNVKIIDQNGLPLGEETTEGFEPELVAAQVKYKKEFERTYEKKIEKVLAPILGGPDKVVAKVTIDFDFEQKNEKSEYYDPESVVRSEQSLEEKRQGATPAETGGVPGAISNIGPVEGTEKKKAAGEKYEKSSTTTNYEISKKVTSTKGPFATVKRITAAVVVDGKYETKPDEKTKEEKTVYVPLDETEIKAIENIVKNSIGYNEKRGDKVAVSNFEFNPLSAQKPEGLAGKMHTIADMYINPFLPLLKYLFAFALLFLFYRKVIAPFGQRMLEEYKEEEEEANLESELEEEEKEDELLKEYNEAKRRAEEELGLGKGLDKE